MGSFKDAREHRAGGDLPEGPRASNMFGQNPLFYEALFGYRLPNGTNRPGMKLSIWGDGERVKICFNDGDTETVGFADLDPDFKLSAAIEEICLNGPIDWKPSKRNHR